MYLAAACLARGVSYEEMQCRLRGERNRGYWNTNVRACVLHTNACASDPRANTRIAFVCTVVRTAHVLTR